MGWWQRSSGLRRIGLLLITACVVVLAVFLPARGWGAGGTFDQVVDWANILASVIGALGLALAVLDRLQAPRRSVPQALDEAADRLMRQVRGQETQQRARLLGTGRASTSAANLCYQRAEGLVRFRETASARTGTLEGVGRYFVDHTRRRLVILGGPGSGKTVLALELLIQLLDQRAAETDPRRRAALAVPVRFSLPAWNPGRPLTAWLAGEVATRFGMPGTLARALLEEGRILPILDGLDEMDPPSTTPKRAAAAVTGLNAYLDGLTGAPVVVTCRSGDYQRLRDETGVVVRPATEITIQPLAADQIREYLRHEYDSSADWVRWRRWGPVIDRLEDPGDQRLLRALRTPWRLTLAVTYHRGGGDLDALLPTPDESPDAGRAGIDDDPYPRRISTLLLSAFIPARTRLDEPGRYTPEQVARWCRTTAECLGDRVDVVPHEWWRVAGANRVRRWHAVVATGIAGLLGLIPALAAIVRPGGVTETIADLWASLSEFQPVAVVTRVDLAWLVFVVVGFPCLALRQALKRDTAPTQVNPQQLRTGRGRRRFVRSLGVGLAIGLAPGLVYGFTDGLTDGVASGLGFGLGFGVAGGLMFGLAYGLRPIGEVTTDPRDPLRNDLGTLLAVGIAAGLGYGLTIGLATGFAHGPARGLAAGLASGLADGLAGGLAGALALGFAGHAWLRYAVAVLLLARRGDLPWRFGRFLHWAYGAGVVRTAGSAYQFRHVELRDWLQGYEDREPSPEPIVALVGAASDTGRKAHLPSSRTPPKRATACAP